MNKTIKIIQTWGNNGLLLFFASLLAIIVANTPAYDLYLQFASLKIGLNVRDIVNDLLMAVFFMTVGIEIKKEMIDGHLSSIKQVAMPIIAAVAGVLVPMGVYIAFNHGSLDKVSGWAIPSATDIAFTLGAMSLLKSYIPNSLKVFITALAIIDDLIAVIVIALFYNENLNLFYIGGGTLCFIILLIVGRKKIECPYVYIVLGIALWLSVLCSGIHATIAGVLLGFALPHATKKGSKRNSSMMNLFHDKAKPWVTYLIIPLFAFMNSDLNFRDVTMSNVFSSVTLGIMFGLFIGKQAGIFGIVWLMIKAKMFDMPSGATYRKIYVAGILCGIGFTMSLFVALLAFHSQMQYFVEAKVGIFAGSLLSLLWALIIAMIDQHKANHSKNRG